MVAELLFLTMLGLMLIGSRFGVAVGFVLGYSAPEIFAINMTCVFVGVFFVFRFWNRFVEKKWARIVPEKILKKMKKYDKLAFLVFPALPVALALGQVGAAIAYKSLYRRFDKRTFAYMVTGQALRIIVSIAIVMGVIELIKVF